MAIIKQGILGGFSGKIASVVGTSWKGIAIIKSLPLSVANPKTTAQVENRTEFGNCAKFAVKILSTIIKPLWDRFSIKMSGYNEFIQVNKNLFAGALPDDPSNLIISKGKMLPTYIEFESVVADGTVTINWDNTLNGPYQTFTDKAYVLLLNINSGEIQTISGSSIRTDGTYTFTPEINIKENDVLYVYIAFAREDMTIVSNTGYKFTTVTA